MIFGFGEKGYTNLLTRALRDVDEYCETIPDPVQLEYHLPNNFCISIDREYEKFIEKLSKRFPHEKEGKKSFMVLVKRFLIVSIQCLFYQ